MDKRFFIFRLNGIDNCVTENPNDAVCIYNQLMEINGIKYEKTEVNNMTTTYYFVLKN
jgi:hypothetical protein